MRSTSERIAAAWCGLVAVVALTVVRPARADVVESTMVDTEGQTAWLYTPTPRPVPGKTYWLVVGVHGVGDTGHNACRASGLAATFDDVIVVGPTFLQGRPTTKPAGPATAPADAVATTAPATRPAGLPGGAYQMSGPTHEAKLEALVAEIGKTWPLHPKLVLHGFSAGAQFVHRFAMHHPDLVAAVSAHSAGSWASIGGRDPINIAAKGIPFAVSCGEADNGRGGPAGAPTRIEAAKRFAGDLKSLGFDVTFATWPGIKHQNVPQQVSMTEALIRRLEAGE